MDEDGALVWDILELITPSDLFLFRKYRSYMLVDHRSRREVFVELYWPEDD